MKICVAGQGAFGQKHLDALKRIQGVEVTSLVGGNQDATAQIAKKYGIAHYTGDLSEGIRRADAVILTTPTKMHFRQGEQVMRAGKQAAKDFVRRCEPTCRLECLGGAPRVLRPDENVPVVHGAGAQRRIDESTDRRSFQEHVRDSTFRENTARLLQAA